jgi:hypothetical protein
MGLASDALPRFITDQLYNDAFLTQGFLYLLWAARNFMYCGKRLPP